MKASIAVALFCVISCGVTYASVLPPLPIPIKSGTGVIDSKQTIYMGLGSAGKSWFKLDAHQKEKKWIPIADFPGAGREQATSVVLGGNIYVFGGVGKNKDGMTSVQQDVYMYNPDSNVWTKLMSHSPNGFTGHVTFTHNGKAIFIGGVNEDIFDGYFEDIAKANNDKDLKKEINEKYFNKEIMNYFYNKNILSFDPATQQWSKVGDFPYSATAGSSVIVDRDKVFLVNGEVKPGLRTSAAYRGDWVDDKIIWHPIDPVALPDGVAGAFGGVSGGELLFAGGANFPGARANYEKGVYYSHAGLEKKYSNEIYALKDDKWHSVGKLPVGLAYGVSIPWDHGVLIVGGESDGGVAVSNSMLIKISNGVVSVER